MFSVEKEYLRVPFPHDSVYFRISVVSGVYNKDVFFSPAVFPQDIFRFRPAHPFVVKICRTAEYRNAPAVVLLLVLVIVPPLMLTVL